MHLVKHVKVWNKFRIRHSFDKVTLMNKALFRLLRPKSNTATAEGSSDVCSKSNSVLEFIIHIYFSVASVLNLQHTVNNILNINNQRKQTTTALLNTATNRLPLPTRMKYL